MFLIPNGFLFAPFLMYVSFKDINKKLKELQETSNELNDYTKKVEVLTNRLVNYKEITISRLDKLASDEKEKEHEQLTYTFDEMLAKFLIDDYFKNKAINLNQIPIEIRQTIIKILQEDLQDSSDNLTELLEKARIKSLNNGIARNLKRD